MRRVVSVICAAAVLVGTACGSDADESACDAVKAAEQEIVDRPAPATTVPRERSSSSGGPLPGLSQEDSDELAEALNKAHRGSELQRAAAANEELVNRDTFERIEELAVLAEQNPDCYTPSERADIEAAYRQWKRHFDG